MGVLTDLQDEAWVNGQDPVEPADWCVCDGDGCRVCAPSPVPRDPDDEEDGPF